MTFEEFLDTDRVQVVLVYEYNNEIWADTARLEDGVLHVFSDLEDGWQNRARTTHFLKRFCRTIITKETLLEI